MHLYQFSLIQSTGISVYFTSLVGSEADRNPSLIKVCSMEFDHMNNQYLHPTEYYKHEAHGPNRSPDHYPYPLGLMI